MDLTQTLEMGAKLIQGNSDDATSELDVQQITDALGGLFGNAQGGLDLSSLMAGLASGNGFGEILSSWLGDGENAPISADKITDLLGSDKVSAFASTLGLSTQSATNALSEALPQMIDQATSGEGGMFDDMLSQLGGPKGAMDTLGKLFG